ncbi:ParH-like protein [Thermomonospora echinospora]|uniref:ParH-like protein n=1 Tax=Thermomonospora echinospora TaxID=1992 RepID=UPI000CDE7A90|nr:ParH-like protein [Thermomonospora echinospora]
MIPSPFDAEQFINRLQDWRGRRIRLEPISLERATPDLPCGALIETATTDYILYIPGATPLHREHIIVHEVAHMLFEHESGLTALELGSALFPGLDPRLVRQVLGRASYTTDEECEAETFASLLIGDARRTPPPPDATDPGSPVLDRVEVAWGRPSGRPR